MVSTEVVYITPAKADGLRRRGSMGGTYHADPACGWLRLRDASSVAIAFEVVKRVLFTDAPHSGKVRALGLTSCHSCVGYVKADVLPYDAADFVLRRRAIEAAVG